MSPVPPNPIEGPHKRKIPLNDNGEPVQTGKKKVGQGPLKKAKTALTNNIDDSNEPVPGRIPAGPSRSQAQSVSVEDVPEEIVCSLVPLN
jgi:hypothetical protein